ncbi:hypothetical protein HWV62_12210 [Athelia sp. TMB]|nr:hypothetical protein HWV62_12210 [Athelia sp. TMB]
MILSRLASSLTTATAPVANDCLIIPATRIAKIFVWADVTTFLIQAAGGSLLTQVAHASLGKKLISFGLFTALLLIFGLRVYVPISPHKLLY